MAVNHTPTIRWGCGTAYDLFASLHVLHRPERFGLRGSWAAGVRSRLTPPQRTILEDAEKLFFSSPIGWVSTLPEPRDAATVTWSLGQIPPAERLPTLSYHSNISPDVFGVLKGVSTRRAWNDDDLNQLRSHYPTREIPVQTKELVTMLEWWSCPEQFGEQYLEALQSYVAVFFAEEEKRISPYLQQALSRAQDLAAQLNFSELMVELSQGVKITTIEQADEVLFAPSYWLTPLVMYDCIIEKQWVIIYGARPADVALVPGEVIPDAMLRALKALSDPTRLLILRYLNDQPQTPSQLARKLRLRPPTVIHHLNTLRLAGLVYVSMEAGEEKRYTVREPALKETDEALRKFLLVDFKR